MTNKWNFVYGKKYWVEAGTNNPVHEICSGWDLDKFKTEKEGIWWSFSLEEFTDKHKTKFVEIGCGLGRIAHFVAPHVRAYNGIDISKTMIEGAVKYNKQFKYDNCFFKETSTLENCLRPLTVDMIYSELVFIHLMRAEQFRYISEIYKVLKPNGLCAIQIPKHTAYENGFTEMEVKQSFNNFTIVREDHSNVLFHYLFRKINA